MNQSVAFITYSLDAILAGIIFLVFVSRAFKESYYWALAGGMAVTFSWLISLNQVFSQVSLDTEVRLSLELFKNLYWVFCFIYLITGNLADTIKIRSLRYILLAAVVVNGSAYFFISHFRDLFYIPVSYWMVASNLICILSAEQLLRASKKSRLKKVIVLSIGLSFVFDIYMYTHSYLIQSLHPINWEIRAAVYMGILFTFAAGALLFKNNNLEVAELTLSRQSLVYTSTALIIGLVFIVVALAVMYMNVFNASWSLMFYTAGFTVFVFFLASLTLFRSFRERVSVIMSKHVFGHKYDYREEWLNLIHLLNSDDQSQNYLSNVKNALMNIAKTEHVGIWLLDNDVFKYKSKYSSLNFPADKVFPKNEPAFEFMLENEWIYILQGVYNVDIKIDLVPKEFRDIKNGWLLVPFINNSELIGFTIITSTQIRIANWEDLDLYKSIGRQIADYIKMHQQERWLAENSQLQAFSKFTAFIVHDLNNVIAQQSLLVKNAEKHKSNPAFIDDMIMTVDNSVKRMSVLLEKLKHKGSNIVTDSSLMQIITESIERNLDISPEVQFEINGDDLLITCEKDRMVMSISHLIKNAQEATKADGEVSVEVDTLSHSNKATITIKDSGYGMSSEFLENQLFRPFNTTKIGKGMGLGTYLTKQYVEELGGNISVTSKEGKGTTFKIELFGKNKKIQLSA